MMLDFCVGLAYGIIVGVGVIMYWVYCIRLRSQERLEKASNMAALADMNLDDVRKFFPQQYFPCWIVMGKYEKVHWINRCIKKAWPFYTKSQSQWMKEIWEPYIDLYRPPSISQLSFQEFSLGTIPPVLLGVRMVQTKADEIAMDAECQWQGNPSIIMRVRTSLGLTFTIQLKDVCMLVVLRFIFRPLVDQLPGFGAYTYSIRKNKKFDFTLNVVGGDIATIPGLGNSVEEMIKTSLLDSLMWPMRVPVPIIHSPVDGDYSRLQRHFNPRRGGVMYSLRDTLKAHPVGILEMKLVQAKDLTPNSTVEKVDPFAFLFIRQMPRLMKRSKTIVRVTIGYFHQIGTLNPIWNEIFELEVEEQATQKLFVKILNEEAEEESELLGCCQVYLKDLEPGVLTEMWIKLSKNLKQEDVKYRGQVNLELLYRPYKKKSQSIWTPAVQHGDIGSTSADHNNSGSCKASMLSYEEGKTQHSENENSTVALHPEFSLKGQLGGVVRGVFSVTVHRAENLMPMDSNGLSDPYVVLKMTKCKTTKQTKVIFRTLNPVWNQTLDFLVEDGIHEMLDITVWDHDTFGKDFLGRYVTSLTKVIHDGEYTVKFELNDVPSGVIFLTLKWIPQPFKRTKGVLGCFNP